MCETVEDGVSVLKYGKGLDTDSSIGKRDERERVAGFWKPAAGVWLLCVDAERNKDEVAKRQDKDKLLKITPLNVSFVIQSSVVTRSYRNFTL